MGKYVDGFVIAVKKKGLKAYEKMAHLGAKVWKKHGALEYFECVGDDLPSELFGTKCLSFPHAVRAKPDETVVFSFIVFKSKAHRDSVNRKVMKDPLMNDPNMKEMPFDMKRMAYGGFKALVEW